MVDHVQPHYGQAGYRGSRRGRAFLIIFCRTVGVDLNCALVRHTSQLSDLRQHRRKARLAPRRVHQVRPQGPLSRPQADREMRPQGQHDEVA